MFIGWKKSAILIFILILLGIGYHVYNVNRVHTGNAFFDNKTHKGVMVAHACGGIDGIVYTNSKEALLQSLEAGFRFIEIDLRLTDDGKIIAVHRWSDLEKFGITSKNYAEIMQQKILGKYTVLDAEEIAKIFMQYDDAYLLVDKFKDYEMLVEAFPFYKDRLLVEVFGLYDYSAALRAGIRYPMLMLWDYEDFTEYKEHLYAGRIKMVTASPRFIEKHRDELEKLYALGVNVVAFTFDDAEFIKENINKFSAIYTNFLKPDILKK